MADELKDLRDWFSRDIQFYILACLSIRSPIAFSVEKIREYVCSRLKLSKDCEQDKKRIDCNIFYLIDSGLVEKVTLLFTYKITARGIDLLINDKGSYLGIKN